MKRTKNDKPTRDFVRLAGKIKQSKKEFICVQLRTEKNAGFRAMLTWYKDWFFVDGKVPIVDGKITKVERVHLKLMNETWPNSVFIKFESRAAIIKACDGLGITLDNAALSLRE